jgi:hypothetical protein
MIGPIDYVAVGFKGNHFDGSIIDELAKAAGQKIIKVIDLFFIVKDPEGNVVGGEYEDQSEDFKAAFADVSPDEGMPLFTEDDIEKIGRSMANDSAAGVLVIEHLWAKDLKAAMLDADGYLISEGRIHPDKVAAAEAELTSEKVD